MKIAVQVLLFYVTFISVLEENEVDAIKIPKIFLRFPEESKAIWSKFKQCIKDQNETQSTGIKKNFKKCKKERKAEVKKLRKLLKEMDSRSLQRQTSDSSGKLWTDVKVCLKDKDEVETKVVWSVFTECMKNKDNDDFLTNVRACLDEKYELESVWFEFKECMNDQEEK